MEEKTKKIVIFKMLIGPFQLFSYFLVQEIFKFFKQNAVANFCDLHYFRFESHSSSIPSRLIVFPIYGLMYHLFIEKRMNEFELERIRFELYQLSFWFIWKKGFLWAKIFKCRNFVPITCMQREFQCLESIIRVVNVKNSHSHWRVVFGPYKSDTFGDFCLLKIIQILSWLVFFEAKIVLVK